jgi:SAM-dependent methyltransferase
MPSEPSAITQPSSAPIDFSRRADPAALPEWMDEPCAYEDFRACLLDLAQVNRLTFTYRPTLQFLDCLADRIAASTPQHSSLHIVDVGCGGGDMLRHIERWSVRRKIPVHLTGIDLNPYAARAAREFTSNTSAIQWITGDAFSYAPPQGIDIVLSSLFTHHLSEPEIVHFLAWMESVARRGWFISDLCREPTPYRLFGLLAKTARWHRFVQHDGPVSFRRAFREPDWERILAAAGIQPAAVKLTRRVPAKLCVERIK